MDQIIDFFKGLFRTNLWPARWHCGYWSDFHGWFYIVSDLLIWSSYFAMPIVIVYYIRRQKNARFLSVYYLFAAFILACGTTHLIDAITFWIPLYRLNALIRFITGIISWITVFYLIKMIPQALSLKPAELLEREIEQRKTIEEELKLSIRQLNDAQEIARLGHWEWDIKANSISWSDGLFKVFGVTDKTEALSFEKYLAHIHPEDRSFAKETIELAFKERKPLDYYHRVITDGGEVKTIHGRGEVITDERGEVVKMIGTAQDVTEDKKKTQELQIKSNELLSVNKELRNFAYMASHDLKEPLRKVMTFGSLLEGEFKDRPDDKAKNYLNKIVNGAERMERLINDILSFSQLSARQLVFENVKLEDVLKDVLSDLEITIQKSGAEILQHNLPAVEVNRSQAGQLFQNLISNAIKFTAAGMHPEINISAIIIKPAESEYLKQIHPKYKFAAWAQGRFWKEEKFCKITIADNGIGFDPLYAEKIFMLFQRLESQSIYEGTGIGLAICKKIVENHHGVIYAESEPGKGAVFTIILPVSQQNFEGANNENGSANN